MRKSYSAKYCGTCKNWCGSQSLDTTNKMIIFDDNEKAKCTVVHDGTMKRGSTQTSCSKWAQRF